MSNASNPQQPSAAKPRPLSPHLQIYRPQISSVLSITHRAAGLALIGGLLLALWAILATILGPDAYAAFQNCLHSAAGQVILIALSFCFFYYWLAEVRYLGWAFGKGFTLPVMARTGWLVVLASILGTALFWVAILGITL